MTTKARTTTTIEEKVLHTADKLDRPVAPHRYSFPIAMEEATLIEVEEGSHSGGFQRDLYGCASCSEKIPHTKARILCSRCLNYHLCSNCYVIKSYAKPHVDSHQTKVITVSGFFVPGAPTVPPKPAPALPPRANPAPALSIKDTVEIPTADWGLLWNIMKAPLQKKGPKLPTKDKDGLAIEVKDVTGGGMASGMSNLPPSPPTSVNLLDDAATTNPMPETWEPLFAADSTPTPIFIALMSTIFSHLDPSRTGYLSPETYSDFLDTQGYQWNANVWKNALDSENNENPKDLADVEFGNYLAEMSISHELRVRSDNESTSESVEASLDANQNYSPKMPMLTKQGFMDLSAIEYLVNPDKALDYLRKALDEYGIWKGLGEMPRVALPNNSLPKASRTKSNATAERNVVVEEGKETMSPPPLPKRSPTVEAKAKTPGMKDEFDEVDLKEKVSNNTDLDSVAESKDEKTVDAGTGEQASSPGEQKVQKENDEKANDTITMVFEKI